MAFEGSRLNSHMYTTTGAHLVMDTWREVDLEHVCFPSSCRVDQRGQDMRAKTRDEKLIYLGVWNEAYFNKGSQEGWTFEWHCEQKLEWMWLISYCASHGRISYANYDKYGSRNTIDFAVRFPGPQNPITFFDTCSLTQHPPHQIRLMPNSCAINFLHLSRLLP